MRRTSAIICLIIGLIIFLTAFGASGTRANLGAPDSATMQTTRNANSAEERAVLSPLQQTSALTSATGTIKGTIKYNSNPLPGVSLTLSPTAGASTIGNTRAITDSDGRYVFDGVFANNGYYVIPSKSGFNFTPPEPLVVPVLDNMEIKATQDFTASVCSGDTVITNTNDSGPGSLRAAISGGCAGNSIIFSNSPANGATNFYDGAARTITLTSGELSVRQNLNIVGPGTTQLTVSGNKASRVFSNFATVTISGLTMSDGLIQSTQHGGSSDGGGIYNAGNLTLINVSVLNNKLDTQSTYNKGGGIFSSGSLILINSTVSGNDAASLAAGLLQGGGIYNSGTLKITGSNISGNHCPGVAASHSGGGIFNAGTATITNSTISGNSVRPVGKSYGGGIYNTGTATITNSTITANSGRNGGGISTFNSLSIGNTVIAGNTARIGPDTNGGVNSRGHNMIGSLADTAITLAPGDLIGVNPMLAPLADNGGPTKTHALQSNSPLINAGDNALAVDADNNPLTTDQRGGLFSRVINNSADIGAYEYSAADIAVSEFGGGPNIPNGGSFNFGQTNVLTPVTKTFNITNTGSTPLFVANLSLPAGFTLVGPLPPNAFPLFPNTSVPFTVRMDADVPGVPSGTLTFDTNVTGKTPFKINIYGAVGAAPTTAVSSITRTASHTLCSPDTITWEVTFTQPIPILTPANFALVDDTGSLDGEAVSIVYGSGTSWNVGAVTGSGSGTLSLKMVNPGNTGAVVTNLPFTGPSSNVNVGAATPYIFPTSATVLPNSTGNQASAPEGFANYSWTIGNGTITGGNNTATITYTAGNNGVVNLSLVATNSGGCIGLKAITVPIQSTLNPMVTNTNDSGAGSLRQAILDASPGSIITFSNTTDGGATDFYDGTQHTITLTTGELVLDKKLTISGPGANLLSISGNNQSRVMTTGNISGTAPVTLSDLTITGGRATESSNNGAVGGGIASLNGLNIDHCIFAGNTAIGNFGAGGGAILGSDVTITNSTFYGNTANGNGSLARGGAIYITHSLSLINSTVSGNTASGGAGVWGGGLYITTGTADVPNTIVNSTIAGNTIDAGTTNADAYGGGIYINFTTYFRNSIIAQNKAIGTGIILHDISGDIHSLGNNLIGDTSGTFVLGDTTGNILNQNPRLAPLGYYGGVFPTHALLSNSPAINNGNNCVTDLTCTSYNPSAALTTDQRGASRIGNVDMGAFELNNSANGGNNRFALPGATQNSPYSYTLAPNAGSFTYTHTGGTLPNGLTVTTQSGVVKLSGTPTQAGLFNFTVTASDGANTNQTDYSLGVLPPPPVQISGQVTLNGNPLSGVNIALTGSSSDSTQTDNSGNYSFTNLAAGGNYTVTPSLSNYSFSPPSATFNNLSSDQTQNFTSCAGSFVVTNTNDSGAGSLRQAVIDACPGSTITFDTAGVFSTPQTIILTSGEIAIGKNLTINGTGANLLSVSGNNASRVFNIAGGANAALNGLTVTGGRVSNNINFENYGGGILNSGTLTLTNSSVSGNSVYADSDGVNFGGGIYNTGNLTLVKSRVSSNSATGRIAGIAADNFGGGIYDSGGSVTLIDSTLSDNLISLGNLRRGAGIYGLSSVVTLINSTVSGNTISTNGGGAGGIELRSGMLTMTNSTVSGNSGQGIGGIFISANTTASLTNCTVSGNTGTTAGGIFNDTFSAASTLNIRNSIISGNTASISPNIFGPLALNDSNIIGDEANVHLAPLGNYGGPTMTRALLGGSSAINAGNNCVTTLTCSSNNPTVALTTDQRGRQRIGNVDIGAFEFQAIKTPLDFDGDGKSDYAVIQGTFPRTNGERNESMVKDASAENEESVSDASAESDSNVRDGRVKDARPSGDLLAENNQRFWRQGYNKLLHLRAGRGFVELPKDVQAAQAIWDKGKGENNLTTESTSVALNWLIRLSSDGSTLNYALGTNTDVFVPADYDGDGKTDAAVWNPVSGFTVIQSSTLNTVQYAIGVGNSNADPTIVGDYDGDGFDDPAVYDSSTGIWSWLGGATHTTVGSTTWMAGAIPAPGDYNGDGKMDFAVQLPPVASPDSAKFRIAFNDGSVGPAADLSLTYGLAVYAIVPGDYDGDGKTDIAQANLSGSTINWRVLTSSSNYTLQIKRTFGAVSTDRTVQGDYDGDGKIDMAIYRRASSPADGVFIVFQTSTNTQTAPFDWGDVDDYPVSFFNSH